MNPEIKAKWLEALRSGRYIQARGTLTKVVEGERQFCCLGVLCDVLSIPSVPADGWHDGRRCYGTPEAGGHYGDTSVYDLPNDAMKAAGLNSHNPIPLGGHPTLTALNDSQEKSFAEIADIIEKGL